MAPERETLPNATETLHATTPAGGECTAHARHAGQLDEQPYGQDGHDGACSMPARGTHGGEEPQEQRKTDEITVESTTPRMRTFLAE